MSKSPTECSMDKLLLRKLKIQRNPSEIHLCKSKLQGKGSAVFRELPLPTPPGKSIKGKPPLNKKNQFSPLPFTERGKFRKRSCQTKTQAKLIKKQIFPQDPTPAE